MNTIWYITVALVLMVRIIFFNKNLDPALSLVETPVSAGEDSVETIEAAEALMNMESPNNILDEKRMSMI